MPETDRAITDATEALKNIAFDLHEKARVWAPAHHDHSQWLRGRADDIYIVLRSLEKVIR